MCLTAWGGGFSLCVVFKQKTADGMRNSGWSSDVCSSDLLEGVEARRFASLEFALHQQFAVKDGMMAQRLRYVGEAAGDVVPGAAVEAGFAGRADDLDADAVPFPFGGLVGEVGAFRLQPVGEHEGGAEGRGRGRAAVRERVC